MKNKITNIICIFTLLVTAVGCTAKDREEKVTIEEPGGSITVIDNVVDEAGEPEITIVRIDNYDNMEISDWLDSDTVVVSKENDALGKMTLSELSGHYPRSLYLYDLNTKEYDLLAEDQDLNLSEAKLSPDKKNLLYSANSLGDPSYYVLNLETLERWNIKCEPFGTVGSARWADQDTIIGTGYMGGAYYAGVDGSVTAIFGLDSKSIYIANRVNDLIYYNTGDDNTLMTFNPSTGETVKLKLENVVGMYPAPDENQLLVLQYSGSKQVLQLCDADGSNATQIAEGVELGGISWSPDQRLIAYSTNGDGSGNAISDLYIYDSLTDRSTQIAVDTGNVITCWSPSGEELVYARWDGNQYKSSIVYLDYPIQK